MTISRGSTVVNVFVFQFEQAGLTLGDPHEYFLNHSNYEKLRKACIGFATDFGKLLGAEESVLYDNIEELYEFEQDLAKVNSILSLKLSPLSF